MTNTAWSVRVLRDDDFTEVVVSEANAVTFVSTKDDSKRIQAVCMNEPFVVWVGDNMDTGLAGDYLIFRRGKAPIPMERETFNANYRQEGSRA